MISLSYNTGYGQFSDNTERSRFEYTLVPSLGNTELRHYSLSITGELPVKSSTLKLGISYNDYEFSYYGRGTDFDESSYERIHTLGTSFFYRYYFSSEWSIDISVVPTISSNFKNGISGEDVVLNGISVISRRKNTKKGFSKLAIGLGHGTLIGEPRLYPVVSFEHKVNNSWRYFIGFPDTGVDLSFNERHKLLFRAYVSGLYANNSQMVSFGNSMSLRDTKLRHSVLDLGVQHTFRLQPNLTTVLKAGYLPMNRLEILDNGNNLIYDFEPDGSAYITMGLIFNLKIKENEN